MPLWTRIRSWKLASWPGTGEYDEEGHLLKVTPSFYVTGLAKVDGRYMMVGGEDFTIRGGQRRRS